jgi:alpha-L-fucosidase
MSVSRRNALALMAAAGISRAADIGVPIQKGPFEGTRASLTKYQVPEWFRDAKFGIWAHWGPQSAAEDGDWYARNMYIQDSPQYKSHVARYGHPTKFGFKDIIPTWKADKFDPEHLMSLYKKAGARYFVSMGVHHDNFDLWNSKHTRWNSVQMGPQKDVVGLFRKAAQNQNLRFGVSEHLWITYKWFAVSHWTDQKGPLAGQPYDGVDPANADLYGEAACARFAGSKIGWNDDAIPDSWKKHWFLRIKDLVDNYQPDLLYTDGALPFEDYGLNLVAHHYNLSAKRHGGKVEAIYYSKRNEDCAGGTCVLDVERGIVDKIWPDPWQADTCIGNWHYKKGVTYKTPKTVIDMLADIVSRNGNLLLNLPLPNSGELDSDEVRVLESITAWMAVNGEGIYGTRPWKIYGEGPSTETKGDAKFNEKNRRDLTAHDIRFTTKNGSLYAFIMGWPEKEAIVPSLAKTGIRNVELLGHKAQITWTQTEEGLKVQLPSEKPGDHAITLKIALAS